MSLSWYGASGKFPEIQFRRLVDRIERPVPPNAEIVTAFTDGQVTLRSNRDKVGYHEAADLSSFRGVEPGDLVVHGLDILRGSVGVSDSRGAISAVCTVAVTREQADSRYIAYAIRAQAQSGFTRALARGIREGGADFRRWDTLAELPIPLPSVEEQRRIADFLDDQVARIDAAISGKRAEAELLHEIYRSRLAQAFGTLPTSDFLEGLQGSGVCLGLLCDRMVAGGTPTSSDETLWADEGVPWISISDMADGGITERTDRSVSATGLAQARLQVQPAGALLLAMYASVGKVSVSGMPAVWNQAILGLTLRPDVPQDFVVAWLELARASLPAIARSATQDNLNADQVRRLRVPVMNAMGMHAVAVARFNARNWLGQTSLQIEQSVSLLEERKRALITATVTGELDVTTAKPIGMGKWVPNVGAGVEAPAAAQASGIGEIG